MPKKNSPLHKAQGRICFVVTGCCKAEALSMKPLCNQPQMAVTYGSYLAPLHPVNLYGLLRPGSIR